MTECRSDRRSQPFNNGEWDNLPAQRCIWYQVQKVNQAIDDPYITNMRSMVVTVDRSLQARTLLSAAGNAGRVQRRAHLALRGQRDSPAVYRQVRSAVRRDMGNNSRMRAARRGVTLVEMLVTVAVLVIIMTVMVQIFQSATGALTAAQTIQDLDNQLKLLDSTIRDGPGGCDGAVHAAAGPDLEPGLFRVHRERVCRHPGRRQRRLLPVHRQGAAGPAVHGADVGRPQPATAEHVL